MERLLLVKYSEIFLKGLNRPWFLNLLLKRIREAVKEFDAKAQLNDSRIYVSGYTDENAVIDKIIKVFGVHSVCPAIEMDKEDFEELKKEAVALMQNLEGTFKVQARRSDKNYPMESPEINARLGEAILKQCDKLSVDVKQPDHILNVEIRKKAYLYVKIIPAVGGMPVGSNGKACLLLSGGIDSPVAGYMLARRGVSLCAVHYYSFPYTGERSKEKVLSLAKQLSAFCGSFKLYIVPFTNIQMEIHKLCPDEYTTLIMRRFMMRIADRIAEQAGASALITGESIGQVASQTMEALTCTDAVVKRPVFRPLIGFDKENIITVAKKIGTYETSCLPYEDCCTVFTPRHPVTRPKLDKTGLAEQKLDTETLIQEAMSNIEVIEI